MRIARDGRAASSGLASGSQLDPIRRIGRCAFCGNLACKVKTPLTLNRQHHREVLRGDNEGASFEEIFWTTNIVALAKPPISLWFASKTLLRLEPF
jgi:hypothetical protein